jgi:hypothetical protein
MAQAVSRRSVTADARFRSRVSPCGICSGQNGTGTGFPLSVSFHRCSIRRRKLIIFITGLHNKPQGCGASVASAAGPFTTKRNKRTSQNSEDIIVCNFISCFYDRVYIILPWVLLTLQKFLHILQWITDNSRIYSLLFCVDGWPLLIFL